MIHFFSIATHLVIHFLTLLFYSILQFNDSLHHDSHFFLTRNNNFFHPLSLSLNIINSTLFITLYSYKTNYLSLLSILFRCPSILLCSIITYGFIGINLCQCKLQFMIKYITYHTLKSCAYSRLLLNKSLQ